MKGNSLLQLQTFGQSIWLDFIRRGMLASGELQQMIEQDGLRGVTSNPSIFDKAIAGSHDYDEAIEALSHKGEKAEEVYEGLAVEDVQHAADLFRPIYDRSDGRDGFVSLEVNPRLAYDSYGTVAEARRLWAKLNRPNVLIKVPATFAGLPAVRRLIAEGINVNVTLLFDLGRYREVAQAYLSGLETRLARGQAFDRVASVASFFLSRIDTLVDPMLERIVSHGGPHAQTAKALIGQSAIASAKIAYQIYRETFGGERFKKLAANGARTQRLLWASTSTKNPAYSDVKYVEPLIGPETVNTLPLEALTAYRDHGDPAPRLTDNVQEYRRVFARLPEVGIDMDAVMQQLEEEGVRKFVEPFDHLVATLEDRCMVGAGSHW